MALPPSWRKEATLVVSGGLGSLVVGLMLGHPTEILLVAALGYLGWHLAQLYRVSSWLNAGAGVHPPSTAGVWSDVVSAAHRRRRHAQKRKRKLNRALRRFYQAAAALPDGVVMLGKEWRIEWWNNAGARMLGLCRPADVGQPITNLLRAPEFSERLRSQSWRRSLEMASPVDAGIWLTVLIVAAGKNKWLLLARDTTRLHRLELVRQDFVANVSHELRTPLTVVTGYVESLMDRAVAAGQPWRQVLPKVAEQAERMSKIVDDLLLLSRLEAGDHAEVDTPVQVAPLLAHIRSEAVALSGRAGHTIELEADASLGLMSHANALQSAFSNLVYNAVRYTPPGGKIRLRWYFDDSGAVLEVSDTGIGIEAKHLARLTERFYRVDIGRSRASGGTGLGLAIVKHVLNLHDATLEVDSEPGKGSVFRCRFPARAYCPIVAGERQAPTRIHADSDWRESQPLDRVATH